MKYTENGQEPNVSFMKIYDNERNAKLHKLYKYLSINGYHIYSLGLKFKMI